MKARKKPVLVDVVQLPELNEQITDENEWLVEVRKEIPYLKTHNVIFWSSDEYDNHRISLGNSIKYWYVVHSLEGNMKAYPGDYLVYGGNDDVWAIKKDIFEKTYEIVGG